MRLVVHSHADDICMAFTHLSWIGMNKIYWWKKSAKKWHNEKIVLIGAHKKKLETLRDDSVEPPKIYICAYLKSISRLIETRKILCIYSKVKFPPVNWLLCISWRAVYSPTNIKLMNITRLSQTYKWWWHTTLHTSLNLY